jgi:hypothetical protein
MGEPAENIKKPTAFDPEKFRSKRGAAIANVETLQQALPILRISEAKDFDPAKPLVSFRINRQLSGWNLPPLMIRAFEAHCQVPTQNLDNSYNRSALSGAESAKKTWVQVTSRRDEGADEYAVKFARDPDAFPEPKWPKQSIWDLIEVTFVGRMIDTPDDPGLLRLIGAKPSL